MNTLRAYAMVNAKVRAMRSGFISEAGLRRLAQTKDLRELVDLLADFGYAELKDRAGYHDLKAMEAVISDLEPARFRRITRFADGPVKTMVRRLYERYEVEYLKTVLRFWHDHRSPDEEHPPVPDRLFGVSAGNLIGAESLFDLIALIEGSPCADDLRSASAEYHNGRKLFALELALDQGEVERLMEASQALTGRDQKMVRRLVGLEIDIRNLSWIGRFKRYYKMSSAEIVPRLLPHGYRLNDDRLREAIMEDNPLSLLGLPSSYAGQAEGERMGKTVLSALENFLYQALIREAHHAFAEFPFSIGAILGYYYLLRIETINIRLLLQGKAYALSEQELEEMLVL